MQAILHGTIQTPIITKRTSFHLMGCQFTIIRPRRRYYNKIKVGMPMYPYSFTGYVGEIEARFICQTKAQAERKLTQLLQIQKLGRFKKNGMGKIKWLKTSFEVGSKKPYKRTTNIRIRKGLPHDLPKDVQRLINYALLHDFFHTPNHRSKVYIEPQLEDMDLVKRLRQHHDKDPDPTIQQFQRYDRLSAIITRKIRSPKTNRYNWRATETINFERIATEIKEVAEKNVWQLYEYIYKSRELDKLNESFEHGHTSLRRHLILIANLIVQDYQRHTL